jgi:hypothetical protein
VIHVALASAPGVLGDLLESVIERDPGFQLTARTEDPTNLARLAADRDLDAVIVCARSDSDLRLVDRLPGTRECRAIVVIAPDGKDAALYRTRGRDRLGELSPDRLLEAIRDAVRSGDD